MNNNHKESREPCPFEIDANNREVYLRIMRIIDLINELPLDEARWVCTNIESYLWDEQELEILVSRWKS